MRLTSGQRDDRDNTGVAIKSSVMSKKVSTQKHTLSAGIRTRNSKYALQHKPKGRAFLCKQCTAEL